MNEVDATRSRAVRILDSPVVAVVLAQTLAMSLLVVAFRTGLRYGASALLPVAVLAAGPLAFGYRRERLFACVVAAPLLVWYAQLLLGGVGSEPGVVARTVAGSALAGVAVTVVAFALGYGVSLAANRWVAAPSPP
jgi:hypothetical protein